MRAVLGLGNDRLAPVAIDLEDGGFLVAGPHRSGRTTALVTIARSLHASGIPLQLIAPRRSGAADEPGLWSSVARGADAADAAARALSDEVTARAAGGSHDPLVVVIDDGTELSDMTGMALETVVRRGRDVGIRVVAAAETFAAHRQFGGWLRELRNSQAGILLQPNLETDGDLLSARLPRRVPTAMPPGRGFLVQRGRVELVQVAS